jgi:hypothetical protein
VRSEEEEEIESIDREQEIQVRRMFVMTEKPMDRISPTKKYNHGAQTQYPLVQQIMPGACNLGG